MVKTHNMSNLQPWHLAEFMYQYGMAVAAQIELEAMKAENASRLSRGLSPAYGEAEIMQLQERYGMHHNPLTEAMRRMQQ